MLWASTVSRGGPTHSVCVVAGVKSTQLAGRYRHPDSCQMSVLAVVKHAHTLPLAVLKTIC